MMEKIQEGVIVNTDDAFLADSIKGTVIMWKETATVSPEISSKLCFVYSDSPGELKKLSELKGHKVRMTYIYEDDGYADFAEQRIYMPIARLVRVEDLGE